MPLRLDASSLRRLRFDRVDSRQILEQARRLYFAFLSEGPGGREPIGLVITSDGRGGRVVMERALLLPEEHFIPIDWIRSPPVQRRPRQQARLRFTPR